MALVVVFSIAAAPAAFADATTEAQLRAALQAATAQIATLENQVANLQASQAPDVALIESLQAKVQSLSKAGGIAPETADQKAATEKAMAALNRRIAAESAALGKTQSAYSQAASTAASETAKNTQLAAELTTTNGQLASCTTKNTALYNLGNQILDAYSHKDDIFGAIADREPFIGFKRVQLQNIVQNDQDVLFNNHIDGNVPQPTP
jgi:chromosome segregation ATPase